MATTKKTIDSTKAKAAPSSTSRPIIVSHGPQIQDPMMKKPDEVSEEAVAEAPSTSKRVIQPLTTTEKPQDAPAEPTTDTEAAAPTEAEKEEAKEAAVVDAVAEQADLGKKNDKGPSEEEIKKQEEIAKLITNKKYFVPIGQVAKRRNKRASLLILALLLVVAGAYVAVDAGLLLPDVQLPFELITN